MPASDPRVKVCGLTNLSDAALAVEQGAWALGMIFFDGSPRRCSLDEARRISGALRRRVELCGVFVNAPLEELANSNVTPAVAKAPWYFLGLQELLAYFHPTVAGVLTPLLVLVGAGFIPYIDRGNLTATRPSERKTAVVLFTMFCALGLTLTFVGIFFRGPGYSFVIPYLPFFENSSPGLHFSL